MFPAPSVFPSYSHSYSQKFNTLTKAMESLYSSLCLENSTPWGLMSLLHVMGWFLPSGFRWPTGWAPTQNLLALQKIRSLPTLFPGCSPLEDTVPNLWYRFTVWYKYNFSILTYHWPCFLSIILALYVKDILDPLLTFSTLMGMNISNQNLFFIPLNFSLATGVGCRWGGRSCRSHFTVPRTECAIGGGRFVPCACVVSFHTSSLDFALDWVPRNRSLRQRFTYK